MVLAVFVVLVFICMVGNCKVSYSQFSDVGMLARIDLINSLKIALKLAQPRATSEERQAGVEFVKFLTSPKSDEYIEAFYANSKIDNTNSIRQFLNGVLFNENPSLLIWNAAAMLIKMLKTKSNSTAVEELRDMVKTIGTETKSIDINEVINPNLSRHNLTRSRAVRLLPSTQITARGILNSSRKHINYIKIYNQPELIKLNDLLTSVTKNLYGM